MQTLVIAQRVDRLSPIVLLVQMHPHRGPKDPSVARVARLLRHHLQDMQRGMYVSVLSRHRTTLLPQAPFAPQAK